MHDEQATEYKELLDAMKREGDKEDYDKGEEWMDELLKKLSKRYLDFRTRRDGKVYVRR